MSWWNFTDERRGERRLLIGSAWCYWHQSYIIWKLFSNVILSNFILFYATLPYLIFHCCMSSIPFSSVNLSNLKSYYLILAYLILLNLTSSFFSYFDDAVMIVIFCVGIIVIPLAAFLHIIDGSIKPLINSGGIFLIVLATISQLYLWSTYILMSGYDTNRDQQIVKQIRKPSIAVILHMEDDVQGIHYGGSSNVNPFEAIKTKNLLSRRQTCREQLKHWAEVLRNTEALMLSQAEIERIGSLVNSSDGDVAISPPPGNRLAGGVKTHGVCLHPPPSPALWPGPTCPKIVVRQLIIMLSNTAALRRAICLVFHFLINDQANLESVRNHPVLEFGEIPEATWTRNLRTNPDLP